MDKTWSLEKITYTFMQEGNTLETTCDEEELIINVETQLDSIEESGGFLVIKTETGWSINNAEELSDIFKLVEEGVKLNLTNNE